MIRTIITTNGVHYQGFEQPTHGAWNQPFFEGDPYHYYMIGGSKFHIAPRPPGTQAYFPFMGPHVPVVIRKKLLTVF